MRSGRLPRVPPPRAMASPLAPVTLRLRWGVEAPRPPSAADTHAFLIPGRGGGALVDAEVSIGDLAAARARWRREVQGAVVALLAITLLVCAGPLIEARRNARDVRRFLRATLGIIVMLLVARGILWYAARLFGGS